MTSIRNYKGTDQEEDDDDRIRDINGVVVTASDDRVGGRRSKTISTDRKQTIEQPPLEVFLRELLGDDNYLTQRTAAESSSVCSQRREGGGGGIVRSVSSWEIISDSARIPHRTLQRKLSYRQSSSSSSVSPPSTPYYYSSPESSIHSSSYEPTTTTNRRHDRWNASPPSTLSSLRKKTLDRSASMPPLPSRRHLDCHHQTADPHDPNPPAKSLPKDVKCILEDAVHVSIDKTTTTTSSTTTNVLDQKARFPIRSYDLQDLVGGGGDDDDDNNNKMAHPTMKKHDPATTTPVVQSTPQPSAAVSCSSSDNKALPHTNKDLE